MSVSVSVGVDGGAQSIEDMVRALRDAAQDEPVAGQRAAKQGHSSLTVGPVQSPVSGNVESADAVAALNSKIESGKTLRHAVAFVTAVAVGFAGLVYGNKTYGPEMYADGGLNAAADAHAKGLNYEVFDLNLNVRALRDAQLARMTKTPEVIIIGASHWQEADKGLLNGMDFYNAHIHRDYWEDLPGMVELLVRHDRLPKKLIVAIRDLQFTPAENRKDWLWEPGIPAYRAFTQRIGIDPESWWKTAPWHRLQALISLPMFFENFTRWQQALVRPGATSANRSETMDMLMPDGSILWSKYKLDHLFTPERRKNEVKNFADSVLNKPLVIDNDGIEAWQSTFSFLKSKGVQVYLVNPPFNPEFYDQIAGTQYATGLAKVEQLTQRFSRDFGFPIFGSFNPHEVGCTADQYKDAEHSNPSCLHNLFDQFLAVDKQMGDN